MTCMPAVTHFCKGSASSLAGPIVATSLVSDAWRVVMRVVVKREAAPLAAGVSAAWLESLIDAFFAAVRCRAVCLATVYDHWRTLESAMRPRVGRTCLFKSLVGEVCITLLAVQQAIRGGGQSNLEESIACSASGFARFC